MTRNSQSTSHVASVPACDITGAKCNTAWMPVGSVQPADDGPGYAIELLCDVSEGEFIYFRTLPEQKPE